MEFDHSLELATPTKTTVSNESLKRFRIKAASYITIW